MIRWPAAYGKTPRLFAVASSAELNLSIGSDIKDKLYFTTILILIYSKISELFSSKRSYYEIGKKLSL